MARRKHYRKPVKRKTSLTVDRKARSMQSSWRKATDRTDSLSIDAAKKIINSPPECPYCHVTIPWQQLSIDHIQPKSREGTNEPDNLVWSCRECNMVKGNLNGTEFGILCAFLDKHRTLKEYLWPRLKAGGAVFGRRRRG